MSDDATLAYAREHLEHLRFCLLGVSEIPELKLAESYFGARADAELECLRRALRRRAKEAR